MTKTQINQKIFALKAFNTLSTLVLGVFFLRFILSDTIKCVLLAIAHKYVSKANWEILFNPVKNS